jgi:RHS repeat-associated protein
MLARSIRSVCSRLILTLVFAIAVTLFTGVISITWAATPPLSVDLRPGSDSGVFDDDDLTNTATATIDIVAATPGDTIRVYRAGVLLGEAAPVDTTLYTYTFTVSQLVEGGNTITARSWDGVEESGDSPTLNIQLDQTGPRISASAPPGPINVGTDSLDSVTVTFNEEIHYASGTGSFTLMDIDITSPGGPITPTGIDSLGGNQYSITFATQTAVGSYAMAVGPDIEDIAGNLMDQDQDGTGGEDQEDVFAFGVELVDVDVVITSNITISSGDMTYDSLAVYINGATVTIDGAHTFASLQLGNGAGVTHSSGVAGFHVTVIGGLTVESGSWISAGGKGYAAESGPGYGYHGSSYSGATGAGHGGLGGISRADGVAAGSSYGSVSEPSDFGSGGGNVGPGGTGGYGGGSIRLTVGGAFLLDGILSASGWNGGYRSYQCQSGGGGAGGSIWVTSGSIAGSGAIAANGGNEGNLGCNKSGGGGGGRIAIYYDSNTFTGTIQARGGQGYQYGGAGTIYLKPSVIDGDLYIDNGGNAGAYTLLPDTLLVPDLALLSVNSGGYLDGAKTLNAELFHVGPDGVVSIPASQGSFHLSVSGDLTVDAGGLISGDGRGFAAEQGPGRGDDPISGYGHCTGAGHGGEGGRAPSADIVPGISYGSITEPTMIGSGGGDQGSAYGGRGGGAVKLTVGGVLRVDGALRVNGYSGGYDSWPESHSGGGGSGGSIWVTTGTFTGTGSVQAIGGNGGGTQGGGGAGGRIAVYYDTNTFTGTIQARGGSGYQYGGAGTTYLKPSATIGALYIDNGGNAGAYTLVGESSPANHYSNILATSGTHIFMSDGHEVGADTLILSDSRFTSDGLATLNADHVAIKTGCVIDHPASIEDFHLAISGDLTIEAGGLISASGKGYAAEDGPGSGYHPSGIYGLCTGAGHGGEGGTGNAGVTPGVSYGSITEPTTLGSGGGQQTGAAGGPGGGGVRLTVGGIFQLNGTVTVNGYSGGYDSWPQSHSGGGGSGGSIWVTSGSFTGSGNIRANGGNGGNLTGGGGAGGRIAIYYDTNSFSGTIHARGGQGSQYGGAGTIYLKPSTADGDLYIDNGGNAGAYTLPGEPSLVTHFRNILATSGTHIFMTDGHKVGADTLTLSGSRLTSNGLATLDADHVVFESGSVIDHPTLVEGFHLAVSGDLTIEDGSQIAASGKGYDSQSGPGRGYHSSMYSGASGAGHGGLGGAGPDPSTPVGAKYCSSGGIALGSGGGLTGSRGYGGRGGGSIRVTIGGTFQLDGIIYVNGWNGSYNSYNCSSGAGGSGGSIWITADALTGAGNIQARGGNEANFSCNKGGGGGGGRIYLDVVSNSFSGSMNVSGGQGRNDGEDGVIAYLASGTPVQLNKQIVSNHNCECDIKRWTFSAFVGQQIRLEDVAMSEPDIYFDLIGPDAFVGFTGVNSQSPLVTIPETGSYDLLARTSDPSTTNTVYSFRLQETSVTDITVDVQHVGTILGTSQAQLYRVETIDNRPMRISLDDTSSVNSNELYVRFGVPPTRGEYDYRFDIPASPDQRIVVPMPYVGTWYILVYGEEVQEPSEFTLLAEVKDVIVESITPTHYGVGFDMQLTLTGGGFTEDVLVELVDSLGYRYSAISVEVHSIDELTAILPGGSVAAGRYVVSVTRPGGDTDQLFDVFEMLDSFDPGVPEIDLVVPGRIGGNSVATIWAEYTNTGENALQAPLLVLRAMQGDREPAILRLANVVSPRGVWTSAMPEGFSTVVQFLGQGATPGVLQPGESVSVPIQYAGMVWPWTQESLVFTLSLLNATDTTPVDWYSLKDDMRPDDITSEVWDVLWENFTSQTGSTWGEYAEMLTDNAIYLARLGLQVTDISDLLAFEFSQADGINVVGRLANSTDAFVPAPGLDLSFKRTFPYSISRRYSLGDFGRGWSHNWDMFLAVSGDGTVTITEPGGSRRIYQPDIRPGRGYFSMEGDFATLTDIGGGEFSLEEANGLVRVFLPDGKLDYVEDTNGNRITAGYSSDLLTSLTHSAGQSLAIGYNLADRIETITDPDGRVTTFGYDGSNEHLTSVVFFDSLTVGYAYSISNGAAREHALTEISLPCCSHQYFTYDDQGRLETSYKDSGAEWIGYAYDNAGMVAVTDSLLNTSEFYLDHRGLVVKTRDARGNTTRMVYDDDYNLSKVTDPAGFSHSYEYDSKGNLTEVTDPLGNKTQFAYEGAFNRMTRLTDANGNSTVYGHDGFGNLTSITYPDSTVEGWGHDTAGNPTSWTNRRLTPVTYEYDTDGRLTAKIYDDLSRIDYEYDTRGNLIYAIEGADTTQFHCDDKDRLQRITYPGERYLEYTYNAAGKRASSTNQLGHRLDYHYDTVGRLESIADETVSEIVHYYYDAAGRLERKDLGNGVYTTYAYDEARRLTDLVNYAPDHFVLSSFVYTYDSRGRRTSMTTLDGLWEYEYDDLGQLTAWTAPSSRRVEYEYDPLGNRIAVTDSGVVTDYTTNEMNQYIQVGSTTYVFDDDGNLTQKVAPGGTTTYTYSDENRLVAVSSPSGNWAYTYDAFNNRVRVDDNGTVTDYVIDPIGFGDVVGEYDHGAGDIKACFDHGFGLLSRADSTIGSAFYTFDAIGSTSGLTDTLGTVVNNYSYEPFGTPVDRTETVENSFQYVGKFGVMHETNGLSFMRARFYDEALGKFSSIDLIDTPNINRYSYASNRPSQLFDPTGLFGISDIEFGKCLGVSRDCSDLPLKEAIRLPCIQFAAWKHDVLMESSRIFHGGDADHYKNWWKITHIDVLIIHALLVNDLALCATYYAANPIGVISEILHPPAWSELTAAVVPLFALDPNEKDGPAGYGPDRLVARDALLPYRVEFENDSTATAPAQIVTITDQLDANLDWTTFALTEVGFGDTKIAVPENSQHFETSVPMTLDTVSFDVQIEAGIHLGTGEVYANFYSIDPATFLPPGVDYGFLPPEDSTGRGQGYFTFVIRPVTDVAVGSRIANIAYITFDFQETIATNQVDPHDPGQGTDPEKEAFVTIAADSVVLTVSSTQGGTVIVPGEGSFVYGWDERVTLTAIPHAGFQFIGWIGDVETVSATKAETATISMNGDFGVTARFGPKRSTKRDFMWKQ